MTPRLVLTGGKEVAICTHIRQLLAGDHEDTTPLRHWLTAVLQRSGLPLHLLQYSGGIRVTPWKGRQTVGPLKGKRLVGRGGTFRAEGRQEP